MSGLKRGRAELAALKAASIAKPAKAVGGGGGGGRGSKAPPAKRARVEDDDDDGASDGAAAAASSSSSSSSAGGASSWAPVVLVKVGDGKWRTFEPDDDDDDVLDMDASNLLEALMDSKLFGRKLVGVEVDDCAVHVFKVGLPDAKDEPTPAEEADDSKFVELKGIKKVRAAAKEGKCKGKRLFIRVRLPGGAASSSAAATVAPAGLSSEFGSGG